MSLFSYPLSGVESASELDKLSLSIVSQNSEGRDSSVVVQYELCNNSIMTLKSTIFGHRIHRDSDILRDKCNVGWVETSKDEVYYIVEEEVFPNTCINIDLTLDQLSQKSLSEINLRVEKFAFATNWFVASL